MRIACRACLDHQTVTEASDFFTGLFLPDGSFASMGFQVSFQAPVVGTPHTCRFTRDLQLKYATATCSAAIDPFVGALHQNDVPIGWPRFTPTGSSSPGLALKLNVTDIGGMDFASWSPNARDARQEGLRIPCVRLVRVVVCGGHIGDDPDCDPPARAIESRLFVPLSRPSTSHESV